MLESRGDVREEIEWDIIYIGRHGRAQGAKRSATALVGSVEEIRHVLDTEDLELLIDIAPVAEESLEEGNMYRLDRGSLGIVLRACVRNIESMAQWR